MSEVRANSITNAAGTGAPAFPNGLTTASGVSFPDGTAAAPSITNTDDTNTGVFFPAADTVAVATAGAERLRVDSSGNVGIGTASPTHNAGTGTVVAHINGTGTQAAVLHLTNGTTGATGIDGFILTRWNDNVNYVWTYENEPIAFGTNNLERFRVGSAGQLSVGATGANYGTAGQVLTSGGSGAAPSWASVGITLGTAVAASGTAIDFTGIPSSVRRVTVMFDGVSTNGTSPTQVRLGGSGGVEATGYAAGASQSNSTAGIVQVTTGFPILLTTTAANLVYGVLTLSSLGNNRWVSNGVFYSTVGVNYTASGSKTISTTLDRVRITTANGTDSFDAGTINIMYE